MKILFVCHANIARSFIAERILKGKLKARGRGDVVVTSAGLYDMKNSEADPLAVGLLLKTGFDASAHRSRILTEDMINEADRVIVMEEAQRQKLVERFPEQEDKVCLLKPFSPSFNPKSAPDIRDCHNRSAYHYRLCFAEIHEAIEGLIECI
ncbi:MAG TPA: hypothetical protein P5244_00205 [Syntrophales bacterium]|nr:hypothetical protein [Syntrophales bacterium]